MMADAVRVSQEFQKLGARGISLMFASGDGGVSGSQPSDCTSAFTLLLWSGC